MHEVIIEKPTVVEMVNQRFKYLNFPNVIVCDLNQEYDLFMKFGQTVGNTGEILQFIIQLAKNELFKAVRWQLQKNVTLALEDYPKLGKLYEAALKDAEFSWLSTLS